MQQTAITGSKGRAQTAATVPVDQNDTDKARDESLLRLLLEQGISSSKASILAAGLTFGVFTSHSLSPALLAWTLGVVAVSGTRVHLLRKALLEDIQRGEGINYNTGLLSAASWGLLAFLPADGLPAHLASLSWTIPIMIATSAMSSYAIVIRHFRDYLVVISLFVVCGLLAQHGTDAIAGTLAYALFGPVIYRLGRGYHSSITRAHLANQQAQGTLQELSWANRQMREQYDVIHQEEEIARHVFRQLTLASEDDHAGIFTWNQAMGSLSGDLIQVTHGSDGGIYAFVGDFTGHGLPAALGAVPTSTVFRTMAEKGLPVAEIARELNRKLHELLPTGYFCCAAVIKMTPDHSCLSLWNGGLPPVVICEGGCEQLQLRPSENLPLGVVGDESFTDSVNECCLRPGDSVYIYTDGVTEAENLEGEMWGRERLLAFLGDPNLPSPRIERLKDRILEFTNLAPPSDDISVLEILSSAEDRSRKVA